MVERKGKCYTSYMELNRRNFLVVSTLGLAGVSTVEAATRKKILPLVVFMQGGAQSPYEFVGALPDAPKEIRGEVGIKRTKQGMPIGEHWPRFSEVASKTAIARAVDSQNTSHNAKWLFGKDLSPQAEKMATGIPFPFIELPSVYSDLAQVNDKHSFNLDWDKRQKRFVPPDMKPNPALLGRAELLKKLDRMPPSTEIMRNHEKNREMAIALLAGGDLEAPFREAEKNLDRYGDNPIGKSASLAAEFAKSGAGISFVYNELGAGWDMHSKLKERTAKLAPPTDQALAELILDARRYGFVVLCTTEHGRSPKLSYGGGRNHHNVSYAIGAGGKFVEGALLGELDNTGNIKKDGIKADQVLGTALAACGLDTERVEKLIGGQRAGTLK